LKPFPLKLGMRQGRPLSTLIEYNAWIVNQSHETWERKGIQIGKEEFNLSLFADYMIF
jgi:hypothetical protein